MNARFSQELASLRGPLAALLCAFSVLLAAVPSAQAARPHVFGRSFGGKGSGAGQMDLRAASQGVRGSTVAAGSGVAVDDATGDVYVADTENRRVDEFEAGGTFVRAWGWGVDAEKPEAKLQSCTAATGCLAGESGGAPGELEAPVFIAVDNSPGGAGDVYVGDSADALITKFTAEGALVGTWGNNGPFGEADGQLAGTVVSQKSFGRLDGIAVTSAGALDVLVSEPGESEPGFGSPWIFQFSQGEGALVGENQLASEPSANGFYTEPRALTVGPEGMVFKVGRGEAVQEITAADEYRGEVTPREEYGGFGFFADGVATDASDLYVVGLTKPESGGQVDAVSRYPLSSKGEVISPSEPSEAFGAEQLQDGSGVAVDSEGVVYVADAATGLVDEFSFKPPSPPLVEEESVSEVTDESAVFSAKINPQSLAGEPQTEYRFQYGECSSPSECSSSAYPQETAVASIAPEFEGETVSTPEPVRGLRAGTTYHFRVVAENKISKVEKEPAVGEERVFTTRGSGGFSLPDGRQWELVSPPNKQGALIEPINGAGDLAGPVQAAAGGDAFTYVTLSPTETGSEGYNNFLQVLSTRSSGGGWSSKDLTIPHELPTTISTVGQEYRFFSEDLSQAAAQPFGPLTPCEPEPGKSQPCLSPAASEQTAVVQNTATGVFTPLETGCRTRAEYTKNKEEGKTPTFCPTAVEEDEDVPAGTVLDTTECGASDPCGPLFADATPDLRHVLIEGAGALTEWSAAAPAHERLRTVSLLPPEGEEEQPAPGPAVGYQNVDVRHAVSADGSRVVWTSQGHLYLRLNATMPQSRIEGERCVQPELACTVQIDTGLEGHAEFQDANSEVSKVWFTEEASPTHALYVYEVGAAGPALVANGVLGPVIGASEDGAYVYFVSNEPLAAGAVNGTCESHVVSEVAERASCDLYVVHDGETALVGVLSGGDAPDWGNGSKGALYDLTARVSGDGRWLAFMSSRPLTGYDNRDALSGERDEEVFVYHAPERLSSGGMLACASCDPTGARPHGVQYERKVGLSTVSDLPLAGGGVGWPETAWLAANVPGWTRAELEVAFYQSRFLSDSGRLFFNSSDVLVPKDIDGVGDVYEWEPAGDGGCGERSDSGSMVFKPERAIGGGMVEAAGCVGLISSGTSTEEAAFLDASETGGDVFFLTDARLTTQDTETGLNVYDAHECTSISPCPPEPSSVPPACNTEASCRAAPSSQPTIFGAPASATFSGPGNAPPPPSSPAGPVQTRAQKLSNALRACRKDRSGKKRKRCETAARSKYGSVKKAKRTERLGRAGR